VIFSNVIRYSLFQKILIFLQTLRCTNIINSNYVKNSLKMLIFFEKKTNNFTLIQLLARIKYVGLYLRAILLS